MNSWIKLSRDILNWEWYHDDSCKALLLHLLLRSNWQQKLFMDQVTVNPGELITSQQHLAMEMGKSRQEIRTALKKLEKTKTIKIISTKKYTHIKLNKYLFLEENDVQSPPPDNQQSTNNKPTNNQISTTTKEYKNKRIKEGIYNDGTDKPTQTLQYRYGILI